ncbi:MAG: hypothetical protein HY711_00220 [Candidatus Melainabacteria bacterium]|nr:hypothetical protein [Candidatus Melainabacteria bacterium]
MAYLWTHALIASAVVLIFGSTFCTASLGNQVEPAQTQSRYLKGKVTATQSPFLEGSLESLPKGTKLKLTLAANLNSEINQKGDEILARVAVPIKSGEAILLPNGWFMHGRVTNVVAQKRFGKDGYVEVEFDTLISPDGNYELPFPAKLSTADNELKALAKIVAIDAAYITKGAVAGAMLSVQLTGIPLAVMSHGYSVAIGAGVGAGIGVIGALKRKGKIACFYPGDELSLTISDALTLPSFAPEALSPSIPQCTLEGLNLMVSKSRFTKDPFGDSSARLLTVNLKVENRTNKELSFFDLAIVSDHNKLYYPLPLGNFEALKKRVNPNNVEEATISFSVDSPKHKYWLVMLDRLHRQELTRVPID